MQIQDSWVQDVLLLADPHSAEVVQAGMAGWSVSALNRVGSLSEMVRYLHTASPGVLLVDAQMPGLRLPDLATLFGLPPVVLLLDTAPPARLGSGAIQWVPRDLALAHPAVLQASLHQAQQLASQIRLRSQVELRLDHSQRQMDQLLRLLGAGAPSQSPRWHSQRVMLERLAEEVARVERHGGNLSIILAEIASEADTSALTWIAGQLSPHKRFSDVIGQYGPHGFLLLLPQTTTLGAHECYQRLTQILQEASDPITGGPDWRLDHGIASYHQPHTTPTRLLREAEEQLARTRQVEG